MSIISNVMASFRTEGIALGFNDFEKEIKIPQDELEWLKSIPGYIVEYDFEVEEEFKAKFESLINESNCTKVRGYRWAEEPEYLFIEFRRRYIWTEDEMEKAFSSGSLLIDQYSGLIVRVRKEDIKHFVYKYAHYCW